MRGAPMRGGAGRKTVSMLDLLRGENLLGISVGDSREKVISELWEPRNQDEFVDTGDKYYKYHNVEMPFFRDELCYVVLYGKGKRGKFRLPWFIKDKNRIRRDITYNNMVRTLERNDIFYEVIESTLEDAKYLKIKNGEMTFYDACYDGKFILYSLHLHRI